jgi:HAE1 family hydrophobic/amphiphilic exporter-1
MIKQALNRNVIILALSIAAFIFLGFSEITAQDIKPSPSPTPLVEEFKVVEGAEKVDDLKRILPEKLEGVPEIAAEYESEERELPEVGLVGVDLMQQSPLSLKEAIVMALENNKDIEVSRQNVRIAEFDVRAASGFYEPRFVGNTQFQRATTPNVSVFSNVQSITQNSIVGSAGFQGSLQKFGTNYSATLNNQRVTTSNPLSLLTPQYNTSFNFSIAQPLFKGRSFDQPRRQIEIAKRNLSLTDTQFRQKSIEIIANVQRAYWNLTFALKNLQVQRDTLRDAKEQLEHNKRLVQEGILAPVDIIAAETQVANFEQNVYAALDQVSQTENVLKNLIAQNRNDPLWAKSVIPTDSVELDVPKTTLPEALSLALENRPELELNEVAKTINEIDQRYFKEQTKPQIDLTAGYTSSGISGTENADALNIFSNNDSAEKINEIITRVNPSLPADQQIQPLPIVPRPPVSPTLTGSNFSSVTDIFVNRYPTYSVGLQFNLPIGNQTAKAQFGKSLVQGEQIRTQREQLEQLIQVDVRNALQSVLTAQASLRSAAISRENSEKQYDSEKRKLDEGFTDIYAVLERQTALMNARSAEIRAQTELNKAIAELQRATGNSLKANDVEARLRK